MDQDHIVAAIMAVTCLIALITWFSHESRAAERQREIDIQEAVFNTSVEEAIGLTREK